MPFLESNIFWGIASIVAGISVSLFFYIYGKNRKILRYTISSNELISDKLSSHHGLDITFKGQRVKNMTSSLIMFFNVGNQVITSEDFSKSVPLQISAKNIFFGGSDEFHVISGKDQVINIYEINKKDLKIEFEFLRPKDSFVISLLHDGNLTVKGVMKTGKIVNSSSKKSLWENGDFSVSKGCAFAVWLFMAGSIFGICATSDTTFSLGLILYILLVPTCTSVFSGLLCMILLMLYNICSRSIAKLKSK